MKIIRRGQIPKPWWCGQWQCGKCATVYETEESDFGKTARVVPVPYMADQRSNVETAHLSCPVCGAIKTITPSSKQYQPPVPGYWES